MKGSTVRVHQSKLKEQKKELN